MIGSVVVMLVVAAIGFCALAIWEALMPSDPADWRQPEPEPETGESGDA